MALGLYSSSLCGVVVLTPSIQAQANKDIIKNANMSTEFHFSQVSYIHIFLKPCLPLQHWIVTNC